VLVGGIILSAPLSDSNITLEALRRAESPFIAVATGRSALSGLSVRIDDLEAAAAMSRHLRSLGHRDFGFIIGAAHAAESVSH